MVDAKISALTAVGTPAGTDEFAVNQGGVSKKITLAQINGYTDPLRSASTAAQAMAVGDTYVTGSRIVLPQAKMVAGVFYRCMMVINKTAGAAAHTVTIRTGTAGTTADTSRATLVTVTPTAAADTAWITVQATFRVVGASAVLHTAIMLDHDLATTGFGNRATFVSQTTSAAFDSTTASMGIGISFTGNTAWAGSVQQCTPELKNLAD